MSRRAIAAISSIDTVVVSMNGICSSMNSFSALAISHWHRDSVEYSPLGRLSLRMRLSCSASIVKP